jgi:hypothetical protein
MRYRLVLGFILATLAAVPPIARSQDDLLLAFDEWVEGTLNDTVFEQAYTLRAQNDSVVMIELLTKPGTYDLDPALRLLDADGKLIAENDDFMLGWNAALIVELAADGYYRIVATRSGGAAGDSAGGYILRASVLSPLQPGDMAEITLANSEEEKERAYVLLLRPDEPGTWAIHVTQPESSLSAQVVLATYPDNDIVFELAETAGLRSATLNADLDGSTMYVLSVQQSFASLYTYARQSATLPITISVNKTD